jgi:hypothetical protein
MDSQEKQEELLRGVDSEPIKTLAASLLAFNPAAGVRVPHSHRVPAQTFGTREVPRTSSPSMVLQDYQQVSDVRNKFYASYGKTFLGPEAQSFVGEMLTSMSMASGPKFKYNRIFALGCDSLCKTFLAPIKDEADREKLEDSMLTAVGLDPASVRSDAEALRTETTGSTEDAVFSSEEFKQIQAQNSDEFKYTYQFGAGLMAMMQLVGEKPTEGTVARWCSELGIQSNTLKKDAAYYESLIRKLAEMKQMMVQMEASAKRKEAAKLKEEAERAAKEAEAAASKLEGEEK